MTFIVAKIDGAIEEAYLVETEILAEEFIRMKVVQELHERGDVDHLKHHARMATWDYLCEMMTNGDISNWEYHYVEPKQDLKDICVWAVRPPCGACSREAECNTPRMTDVGMMQE